MPTVEDVVSVLAGRLAHIAGILCSVPLVERLQLTLDKEALFVVELLGPFGRRACGNGISRACTDPIIVLGEAHLRRVLTSCATYYLQCSEDTSITE